MPLSSVLLPDAIFACAVSKRDARSAVGRTLFLSQSLFSLLCSLLSSEAWLGTTSSFRRWTPYAAGPPADRWRASPPPLPLLQGAGVSLLASMKLCSIFVFNSISGRGSCRRSGVGCGKVRSLRLLHSPATMLLKLMFDALVIVCFDYFSTHYVFVLFIFQVVVVEELVCMCVMSSLVFAWLILFVRTFLCFVVRLVHEFIRGCSSELAWKDLCRDKSQGLFCCCCVFVVAVVVLLHHICIFVSGTQVTRVFAEVFVNKFFCSMSWCRAFELPWKGPVQG